MDPAVPILMLALIALVSGVLCAVVASEKNRNSGAWGVVGFLFPILTLIALPVCLRRLAAFVSVYSARNLSG